MVDQALLFLERFGYHAIAWFWIPMIMWTACLVIIYPFLRLFYRLHPNYQYHARMAILYSLPVGLLLFLLPVQEYLLNGDAPLIEAAMVRTLYFHNDSMVAASQTPGSWYQVACTFVGAISVSLLLKGFLQFGLLMKSYLDLRALMKHTKPTQSPELNKMMMGIAKSIGIRRIPELLVTDKIYIPLTFGFLKPVIVLPSHIVEDKASLHPVFLHELVHVLRCDYLFTWFEQILISFGGVNPLLRLLTTEIEDYREQSCDAMVLVNSGISKNTYASILFQIAQFREPGYGVDLRFARTNGGQLRRRIRAIKNVSLTRLYGNHRFVISKSISIVLLLLVSSTLAGAYHMNFNEEFNPATRAPKYQTYDIMPSFLGFTDQSATAFNYPHSAMLSGTQGTVLLDLRIDESGKVNRIKVDQDPGSGLGTFARKQVEKARFTPAIDGGRAVESNVVFPVTFDLTEGRANIYYGIKTVTTAVIPDRIPSQLQPSSNTISRFNRLESPVANQNIEIEPEIFLVVEEDPQLIGGLESLQRTIRYPEIARKAGIEGRVFVQFVVNEQGNVVNPIVTRGIGGGCDEAALEAVRKAKFQPGKQRGRPVKVQYSLPITFRLVK